MILAEPPYYTHSFGAMGETLASARRTEFFAWFHLEEAARRAEPPGEAVRFRASGATFRELCYLDALTAPEAANARLAALELVVRREFLDGRDALFAQDLVKSFLMAALPDACREVLQEFLAEMNVPGGEGVTPGFGVFRGREAGWTTETGWSRVAMANAVVEEAPSLVVSLSANPKAPNATPITSA